jgi:hypothetical protein
MFNTWNNQKGWRGNPRMHLHTSFGIHIKGFQNLGDTYFPLNLHTTAGKLSPEKFVQTINLGLGTIHILRQQINAIVGGSEKVQNYADIINGWSLSFQFYFSHYSKA